jgi:CheY-like chemotaxis protein
MVEDQQRGFALGAADYLVKPIHRKQLLALLDRYLPPRARLATTAPSLLIVEDDHATREILRRMLEPFGYHVVEARHGREALRELAGAPPDLILLDLMMPEMDGFDLLTSIRSNPQLSDIPVIIITAKTLTSAERDLLKSRVQQILFKGSYTLDDLLEHVRQVIASTLQIGAAEEA